MFRSGSLEQGVCAAAPGVPPSAGECPRPSRALQCPSKAFRRPSPAHPRARRGVTSLFAMLYLLIFSVLAVGFYGAVTMAVQLSHNDERGLGAQVAAESGMTLLKYHLQKVKFPSNMNSDDIFREVVDDLTQTVYDDPNWGGRGFAVDWETRTIHFPGGTDGYMIPINAEGSRFRATLQDMGNRNVEVKKEDGTSFAPPRFRTYRVFKVKVLARYKGQIARAIEMDYFADYKSLTVFDFGAATRGPITISGEGGVFGPNSIDGSVLSTWDGDTPVTTIGGSTIAGKIYLTNPDGNVSLSQSSSVGGETEMRAKMKMVEKGVEEPEFPTVDSSPFLRFATNPYINDQQPVYTNVLVPANKNPQFASGTEIRGVLYVKHPNKLKFTGNVRINGIIIVENGAVQGPQNSITFGGGINAFGLETLPDNSDFPADMKKLRGSVLLAPNHTVSFTGGSGTIGGTMVADGFSVGGTAGGVVKGNLIGVGKTGFSVSGKGRIERTRSDELPQGFIMTFTLQPQYTTYTEVSPW